MTERSLHSGASGLDVDLLEVFCKVAQTLNFSRAAVHLNQAQPVITRKIKRLEGELGVALFRRTNRGCELTPAGKLLESKAGGVLLQLSQLREEVSSLGNVVSGPITLGVTAAAGALLAPHLISSIASQWPLLRVNFVEDISRTLCERVLNRELSLALLYDPPGDLGLVTTPLLMERLHLIGVPGAPLAALKRASVRDMAGLRLVLPGHDQTVRVLLEDAFAEAGTPLVPVYESNSLVLLRAMAAQGLGCTVLTLGTVADDVAAGRLVAVPLAQRGMSLALTLVTTPEQSRLRIVELMTSLIVNDVRQLARAGKWPGSPQVVGR